MKETLPERASLEYLKKRAKERLRELRQQAPETKLAAAQFELARDLGFTSWRALKQHVERQREALTTPFFAACDEGRLSDIERLLQANPDLVHERHSHHARTGLHGAAIARRLDVVQLLLRHGADPNARDAGDNASPLHFAAELGEVEIVRALLDSGGDPVGAGDVHESSVIGWALCLGKPRFDVAALLVERGARHHIFSALVMGDANLVQDLVEHDPDVLSQRMSRFEHRDTPLHFAARRSTAAMVELLLQLGADLEVRDDRDRTPLARALLAKRDDNVAALRAAGAKEPERPPKCGFQHLTPVQPVADFRKALRCYEDQLGFKKNWDWGEPPAFGCVQRDDLRLFLGEGSYHGSPGGVLFIDVENVDALEREYQASGAQILEPPKNQPWGSREMLVADLDGNRLRMASPVEAED